MREAESTSNKEREKLEGRICGGYQIVFIRTLYRLYILLPVSTTTSKPAKKVTLKQSRLPSVTARPEFWQMPARLPGCLRIASRFTRFQRRSLKHTGRRERPPLTTPPSTNDRRLQPQTAGAI